MSSVTTKTLVGLIADELQAAYAQAFRLRSDAEDAARIALDACHSEELAATLRELIAAADDTVSGEVDVAAVLRYGVADTKARALLAKLGGAS